jgi:hypothetical protein
MFTPFTPPPSTGLFHPRVAPSNFRDYSELRRALEFSEVCPIELDVEIDFYIYLSNRQYQFKMNVINGVVNITPVGLDVDPLVLRGGTIIEKPTTHFWVINNTSSIEEVFAKTLEVFINP